MEPKRRIEFTNQQRKGGAGACYDRLGHAEPLRGKTRFLALRRCRQLSSSADPHPSNAFGLPFF
jgi:hypothetical protein